MQNKKVGFWSVLAHGKILSFLFYRAKPASQIVAKRKADCIARFQWFTTEKGRFTTSLFSMMFYIPK